MSTITLREITNDNIRTVLKLSVSRDQERFVPSVAHMIARGSYEDDAWFKVVYADDEPVGFVKVWEQNPDESDLWGLMIDQEHQGKGYAREAVEQTIELIRSRLPAAKGLCVGFLAEDGNARAFYEKCGFKVERREQFEGWEELIAYRPLI